VGGLIADDAFDLGGQAVEAFPFGWDWLGHPVS
jgi:hypothetical protein